MGFGPYKSNPLPRRFVIVFRVRRPLFLRTENPRTTELGNKGSRGEIRLERIRESERARGDSRRRAGGWSVGGGMAAERQLVVAVEGTAALGPFWSAIEADYVEKIVRYAVLPALFPVLLFSTVVAD